MSPSECLGDRVIRPKLVAEYPSIGEFQGRATRQIPVVMLTRLG